MGPLPGLLELAHAAARRGLAACLDADAGGSGLCAVDGTCGNGHDTLFLAQTLEELAGEARQEVRVLALDAQETAVEAARRRVERAGLGGRVRFALGGHEHLGDLLHGGRIAVAMYNLGFLPGSDKELVTRKETTLASLEAALAALLPGGVISVHGYGGHRGGEEELRAVQSFFQALSFPLWTVARYEFCNKTRNPERLFLATLRRSSGARPSRKPS